MLYLEHVINGLKLKTKTFELRKFEILRSIAQFY
jgi:hypothetical protein